jgi:uncharacterized oligopeptide transporter (OPT) family protein
MPGSHFISGPDELFVAAVILGVVGAVVFAAANVIMRVTGDDIRKRARESDDTGPLGPRDQMHAFYSNPRNMPVAIGIGGLMMLAAGILMAVGALVWFVIRALS